MRQDDNDVEELEESMLNDSSYAIVIDCAITANTKRSWWVWVTWSRVTSSRGCFSLSACTGASQSTIERGIQASYRARQEARRITSQQDVCLNVPAPPCCRCVHWVEDDLDSWVLSLLSQQLSKSIPAFRPVAVPSFETFPRLDHFQVVYCTSAWGSYPSQDKVI